jgi:hypothetical protein
MSYLRETTTTNNLSKPETSSPAYPLGYSESETMVQLEPSPRPISTQQFDHNAHLEQKEICNQLKKEDPELFNSRNVIMKGVSNERQYKQRQQFSSKSSVESLCEIMDKHNTVLKCNFIRPGFNASNTCLMCTPDMLRKAMKEEADNFNLKKLKIQLSTDDALSPANGSMYLSLSQNPTSGKHTFYSLDYHVSESKDAKLFSQH